MTKGISNGVNWKYIAIGMGVMVLVWVVGVVYLLSSDEAVEPEGEMAEERVETFKQETSD